MSIDELECVVANPDRSHFAFACGKIQPDKHAGHDGSEDNIDTNQHRKNNHTSLFIDRFEELPYDQNQQDNCRYRCDHRSPATSYHVRIARRYRKPNTPPTRSFWPRFSPLTAMSGQSLRSVMMVCDGGGLRRSDQTGVDVTKFDFWRAKYLPSPFWPVTSPSLTTVLPRTMVWTGQPLTWRPS